MHNPEHLILRQAVQQCCIHARAVQEALDDMGPLLPPSPEKLTRLEKMEKRLLDQFAYRYIRLQDDMGNHLFPALLRALGEEIANLPVIDRLARLEQLGWLPSMEEWLQLRKIRNAFAHDYPATTEEQSERLSAAVEAARHLQRLWQFLLPAITARFPATVEE